MHIYIYIYVHVYIYIYMHAYIYIYTKLSCSWNPFENNPPVSMVRLEKKTYRKPLALPRILSGVPMAFPSVTPSARPGPAGPDGTGVCDGRLLAFCHDTQALRNTNAVTWWDVDLIPVQKSWHLPEPKTWLSGWWLVYLHL